MQKNARGARTLVWCVLVSSCQTYDFEPVTPFTFVQYRQRQVVATRGLKPNLMLLVDRSYSMNEYLEPGCSQAGCPTRLSELKAAMASFLPQAASVARLGLTVFPSDDGIYTASNRVLVPLPAPTLTDEGASGEDGGIEVAIAGLVAKGGTPTAGSLAWVSAEPGLTDDQDHRQDYVLLLTDGVPNCNAQNQANLCHANPTAAEVAACACTGSCAGDLCALGCLDRAGTVETIASLRSRNLKTIVIGFGGSVTDDAGVSVLEAMGAAGGFTSACASDLDCGVGDRCAGGQCGQHFFAASDGVQLGRVLQAISAGIAEPSPCTFRLDQQPSEAGLLSVRFDGVHLQPGPDTWSWSSTTGELVFAPASSWCAQLQRSTDATPVTVEIQIVQRL